MVSDDELQAAIGGLGFSGVAATELNKSVSPRDLRTDVRGALQAFLDYVTSEGVP